MSGPIRGGYVMPAICAIVVCGPESGITEFFVALHGRYPYTVLSEEREGTGRCQARLLFKNETPPEEIERFVCGIHAGIQTGICNCNSDTLVS
jgi:hypothetical protein